MNKKTPVIILAVLIVLSVTTATILITKNTNEQNIPAVELSGGTPLGISANDNSPKQLIKLNTFKDEFGYYIELPYPDDDLSKYIDLCDYRNLQFENGHRPTNEEIAKQINENSQVTYSPRMSTYYFQAELYYTQHYANTKGMTFVEYAQSQNMSELEKLNEISEHAETDPNTMAEMCVMAIGQREGIEIPEDELEKKLKTYNPTDLLLHGKIATENRIRTDYILDNIYPNT